MLPTENKAAFSLALVYALRMLGLFMILPVFSLHAHDYTGATPVLIGLVPYLQVVTLTVGLVFSICIAYRIGRQHSADQGQTIRGLIPIAASLAVATLSFLRLYLG